MKFFSPYLIIVLSLLLLQQAHAQDQGAGQKIIVRGKVTDKKNAPIHGVSVTEIDAENRIIHGTTTDVDGNFALRISSTKNRLSFSIVGYKAETQKISDKTSFSISLETGSLEMQEVTVISGRKVDNGMVSIPEKDLTIASSHINAKAMEEMQAGSIDQALQGRLAGVDITAQSGD